MSLYSTYALTLQIILLQNTLSEMEWVQLTILHLLLYLETLNVSQLMI